MAKLEGKVAVITGASSGIGEATAEALAAEGAAVVVAARREDRLADLVGRIEKGGGRCSRPLATSPTRARRTV
jgi:NADP-dependent 3-hydroxy acid dehydrogenase YdfG